jgi:DNA-binding CsgD family transcriptional regulator
LAVGFRELVGREEELASLLGLLDARDGLPAVAVVTGEAGIGKTTLWRACSEAAEARGYLVLSSRPAEAEARFSFVGLADLIGGVVREVLPQLLRPQRRALEAALALSESDGARVDEGVVAFAFLSTLRNLVVGRPLLLAIDDVQWLDAPSLAMLRFAMPRLDAEPVAAILTARDEVPLWRRRGVPDERLLRIELGPLSVGALHELLRTRLGAVLPRPTLLRIWETSGGNPFFALELASAIQRRGGRVGPGEELPIPSNLEELVHERVDRLGAPGLEVARSVAALADPTVTLVEAALGARFDPGLTEALDAKILELDGEHVRFTHPLLGSAVAARQTPARRQSLHARLADIVPSAEERARHLALATVEPDTDVASTLEEAAGTAHARGAPAAAADLAEEALRLTPASSPNDARRRVFIAADMHSRAGDTARATALLDEARAAAAPGTERAAVLANLARAQLSLKTAVALYREALSQAEGDDALQATIHRGLARLMRWGDGIEPTLEHAELAVRAASRVADAELRCLVLGEYGSARFAAGLGIATETMEEALSLERSLGESPLDGGPTVRFGEQLLWSADVAQAREFFQELLSAASARNDPYRDNILLRYLGFNEWRAGNWEEAHRYAADSVDLARQLGWLGPPDEFPAAVIAAHRGLIEEARARAEREIARAEADGIRSALSMHGWVLGFIELSLGDANAALVHLRRAYELGNDFMLEPAHRLELGDLLEALIAVGELDEASEVIATWEKRARALDRAWALAILARCRALLLAARGDLEGAFASFERALAEHARSTDPFHHARTLLALGRTQRRAKQRGDARVTLEQALAIFEQLGAPLWAEKARAELRRIGGRAPSRGELTEAERRIAGLVAEGRTNREVAAALFVTEHTVEGALTRTYRKLGVRSRAELAAQLRRET